MPDFRASGIAGHDLMTHAFRRPWLPDADPEADDVLSGVDMLTASGLADPAALFLAGYSYGGYLAGRILARDRRFRAAACCDAVADLRILDAPSRQMQAGWLGGDPGHSPRRWADASPVARAADIRTPMLLIYSGQPRMAEQGEAWRAALTAARTEHKLLILHDADHTFSSIRAQRRVSRELAGWFDRHSHA